MGEPDTICAIATAAGAAGIGVIRVSGPGVDSVAQSVIGRLPEPRRAELRSFRSGDGEVLDRGLALYFPGPDSFTGEDVLELHGHGGPVVLGLVMETLLAAGCRQARPGEFSERAFLNDKLDLVQAEAIADLIDSSSAASVRAANQSLSGTFSKRIQSLLQRLIELRVHVESAIDFPEEEIDFLADEAIARQQRDIRETLQSILDSARQGQVLRDGIRLAIVGRPNAGKSSLLNALAGAEHAIVTDIPGTTRDVLRTQILIHGIPVHLADTAGLRDTEDVVEAEGVRRAEAEMADSDLVLRVVDLTDPGATDEARFRPPEGVPLLTVLNKADLQDQAEDKPGDAVVISALTGEGLDRLRQRIAQLAGLGEQTEGQFSARRRHLDALRRVQQHVESAGSHLADGAGELVAEELRQAQHALSEITGEFSSDQLLGEIFSSFCIGK